MNIQTKRQKTVSNNFL